MQWMDEISVFSMFLTKFNRNNSGIITEGEINNYFARSDRTEGIRYKNNELKRFKETLDRLVKQGYISMLRNGVYKYNGNLKSLKERISRLQIQCNGGGKNFKAMEKEYNLANFRYISTSNLMLEAEEDNDDLDDDFIF